MQESKQLSIVFRDDKGDLNACDALCTKDPENCGTKEECASMGPGVPEGKPHVLEVVAGLREAALRAVLHAHGEAKRVWTLDFSKLKSPWDAFGGFACKGK